MAGFQDILGHEMIKDHFRKAIENHKVSHAYILAGEEGMGRKSLANAFAMTPVSYTHLVMDRERR